MRIIRGSELPYVPASHENPQRPGVLKRVLATRQDLRPGRVQMVNWARLPRGSSFQAHYHEDLQEVFVIMHGRVILRVDGSEWSLTEGDAVLVDPGEVHEMRNIGDADVEYLVFGITTDQGGRTVVVE